MQIDSTLADSVEVVFLDGARSVIFPASYSPPYTGFQPGDVERFTPLPELIRSVEPDIKDQFKHALIESIERQMNDPTMYGKRLVGEERDQELARHRKGIERDSKRFHTWDRQYVGYFNEQGEQMLLIQFVDFNEDPHRLHAHLGEGWISGWRGWFDSNTSCMTFNVKQKQLGVY